MDSPDTHPECAPQLADFEEVRWKAWYKFVSLDVDFLDRNSDVGPLDRIASEAKDFWKRATRKNTSLTEIYINTLNNLKSS